MNSIGGLDDLVTNCTQTPVPTDSSDQAGTPVVTDSIPIQLTASSYPATFTTCALTTGTTTEGFDPSASVPSGAVCYQVVQTSDAIHVDTLYTVGVKSGGSSDAPTIAGAVIGSVVGATLIVLGFIYWKKNKARKQRLTSAASRGWTQRTDGWIDDRKPQDNIVLQTRSTNEDFLRQEV